MMKRCELCRGKASIYCEADRASLCWDCDARVHSANFLVARHSRNMLCRLCHLPTVWSASGAVLSPTISVCEKCVNGNRSTLNAAEDGGDGNQVVPAPWAESESSSCSGDVVGARKRRRENVSNVPSDDDRDCISSKLDICFPKPAAVARIDREDAAANRPPARESIQPQKNLIMSALNGISDLGILESLRRFQGEDFLETAECRTLSGGPSAVDLSSCDSSS